MTRLCVPLVEKTTDALLAAMRALPPEVDLVEVRVDAMAECDLERVCGGKDRPIIVTNRPVRQGGACTAPEEERLAVLRRAAGLGADYVDVELDSAAALGAPARRHRPHRQPPRPGGHARRPGGPAAPHPRRPARTWPR